MTEFQGVPIDERILSDELMFYSILLPVSLCLFAILWFFLIRGNKASSQNAEKAEIVEKHILYLEKAAQKKPHLQAALEEQRTKQKEEQKGIIKERRRNRFIDVLMLSITVFYAVALFFFAWFPSYRDTLHKDYATYTGSFTVEYTGGRSSGWWILLPDGKRLNIEGSVHDSIPAKEGDYTGTVVYAPRSRLVLGIAWEYIGQSGTFDLTDDE